MFGCVHTFGSLLYVRVLFIIYNCNIVPVWIIAILADLAISEKKGQIEGIREQGAKGNVWTEEGENKRKMA